MMYKFGVVGPVPSVEKILDVSKESPYEIEFIPLPYENPQEVKAIIEQHRHEVHGWFFSGPIPYLRSKELLHTDANVVYCKPTGASLFKSLLELSLYRREVSTRISIDMIYTEDLDLQESLLEAGFPMEQTYIKMFDQHTDPDELVEYHLKLWREGKIDGALTCMTYVYQALQGQDFPVYRIGMTQQDIRLAVKMIHEQAKSSFFKDTQIGVEIIEIDQFDQISEKSGTRYHLQHLELKIKHALLLLCERIDGSLLENGNGRYQIFSSRGAIERELEMLRETVKHLSLEANVPVAVGIGFGTTAFSAENHARRAVQHAKEKEDRGIVIVQENGVIVEAAGEEEELTYAYRTNNKELLEKLAQANISAKTYNKIEALVQRMGWDGFTTASLASHLSMTIRNAQRIMGSLVEYGLAEVGGEELHSVRGRPSKIYRLTSGLK
ncbi:hypothetical protein GCM10023310_52750 [Paenibacillus vulneris]